jgi:hypothetical protein
VGIESRVDRLQDRFRWLIELLIGQIGGVHVSCAYRPS